MSIQETLNYIHNVKWRGSKPGLSRTRELLASVGNPERRLKFIHVAGTNGKGSTCACIASVLKKAGYKTGLYTSPYLIRFNERIQINGEQISDDELTALTNEIKPFADAMKDSPTEFELITVLAMKHFFNKGCDLVVLEVGMGGELDSTNVIEMPELAVITAIDYDHTEHLGPTLRDIARAKAGIIKKGSDVLIYGGDTEVEEVLLSTAAGLGARLHRADFSRIKKAGILPGGTKLIVEPYDEIRLPLAGSYQPYNALMAITALELLREKGFKIRDDHLSEGLASVKWPGRFEFLGHNPAFILDGAHNLHGVRAAIDSLIACFGERKFLFVMGVLADRDAESMVAAIAPQAQQVFAVAPDYPRAMSVHKLATLLEKQGVAAVECDSVSEGVQKALNAAKEKAKGRSNETVICALGSLYMSADVRTAYERYHKVGI